MYLKLFRFEFFREIFPLWKLQQRSHSNTCTVSLNMSQAMAMKMIGWNVMTMTIKLTGRIPCCATDENRKNGKLDIFVIFTPKSSIGTQSYWDIETRILKILISVIIVKKYQYSDRFMTHQESCPPEGVFHQWKKLFIFELDVSSLDSFATSSLLLGVFHSMDFRNNPRIENGLISVAPKA